MSRLLSRENIKLGIVAVFCLLLAWTGPSIAHGVHAQFAHNADKVDGKHAVGAGAGPSSAAGKLVAHNGAGQVPAKFIPKVKDADKLDGLNSTAFVARDAKPGQVQTGPYSVWGANGSMGGLVQFRTTLPPGLTTVSFIASDAPLTAACPGPGQAVGSGRVCIYEAVASARTFHCAFDTASGGCDRVGRAGFGLWLSATSANSFSYGTWAVRAPDAAPRSAAPHGRRAGQ